MSDQSAAQNPLLEKIFNKALFFLKFRFRSEKEIVVYLKKQLQSFLLTEYEKKEILNVVLSRLKNLNLVDDYRFAYLWVENRLRLNPKGKKIITFELRQKGIEQAIIDKVLTELFNKTKEEELIKKLLAKAESRYKKVALPQKREKIIRFMVSRGFSLGQFVNLLTNYPKRE